MESRIETPRRTNMGRVIVGGLFMAAGVLLFLGKVEMLGLPSLTACWPLVLVGLGLDQLTKPDSNGRGTWLVVLGCWLLAVSLDLFGLTVWNSWPLLLVAGGMILVWQAVEEPETAREERLIREE
jgi:hypothetical protein